MSWNKNEAAQDTVLPATSLQWDNNDDAFKGSIGDGRGHRNGGGTWLKKSKQGKRTKMGKKGENNRSSDN
eukprot:13657596-Ditylum_brightwellii.AAC.1